MNKLNEEATLLLSLVLDKTSQPLTDEEIRYLYKKIADLKKAPADLLDMPEQLLENLEKETGISCNRLKELLSRGNSVALHLDQWKRQGIWWESRSNRDFFTEQFRRKLNRKNIPIPAVIFGCGLKPDLGKNYIKEAIGEFHSGKLSTIKNLEGNLVLLRSTEEDDSPVVGVIKENLEGLSTRRDFVPLISSGKLTLISINSPTKKYKKSSYKTEEFVESLLNLSKPKNFQKVIKTENSFDENHSINVTSSKEKKEKNKIRKNEKIHQLDLIHFQEEPDKFFQMLLSLVKDILVYPMTVEEMLGFLSSGNLLQMGQLKKFIKIAKNSGYIASRKEGEKILYEFNK